jgi:hypothetical protein
MSEPQIWHSKKCSASNGMEDCDCGADEAIAEVASLRAELMEAREKLKMCQASSEVKGEASSPSALQSGVGGDKERASIKVTAGDQEISLLSQIILLFLALPDEKSKCRILRYVEDYLREKTDEQG